MEQVEFELTYGTDKRTFSIPRERLNGPLLAPRQPPVLPGTVREILDRALAEPVERPPLRQMVKGRQVGVVISDEFRAGLQRQILEALVAEVAGEEGVRLVKGVLGYGLEMAKLAKELLATADPSRKRPADDFFRYFAYLVFRPLREKIYRTMTEATWRRYAEEVARYLRMRIEGLGLGQKA